MFVQCLEKRSVKMGYDKKLRDIGIRGNNKIQAGGRGKGEREREQKRKKRKQTVGGGPNPH